MSTLLLRLAAPMQSWGAESKFERRITRREPTKSGVIGLIAAAMGRARSEPLNDLAALKFGVRIDQPGQLLKDFHTAKPEGADNPYVTDRHYLCDAVFLVGLEGDSVFLMEIERALNSPVYPLYLGRRSCPPDGKICLGLRESSLRDALCAEPWQAGEWYQKREKYAKLTLVTDSAQLTGARYRDLPLTFDYSHRQYTYRYIEDIPNCVSVSFATTSDIKEIPLTTHDAFEGVDI